MNIDWKSKPDWADVWIETTNPDYQKFDGGWYYEEDGKWRTVKSSLYWVKMDISNHYKAHYPPVKQEENIMNKEQAVKQLTALQAEMDKLKAIIDKPVKWEPSGGDWYVTSGGGVRPITISAQRIQAYGVEFDSKEDAEEAAAAYRAYHRLYKWVKDNDDGWRADWNDHTQYKYTVFYNRRSGVWYWDKAEVCHVPCVVFMSHANAKKLIAALNSGEVVL